MQRGTVLDNRVTNFAHSYIHRNPFLNSLHRCTQTDEFKFLADSIKAFKNYVDDAEILTWAKLMMISRNRGWCAACCFSLLAKGLLSVLNTSVPSFANGSIIVAFQFVSLPCNVIICLTSSWFSKLQTWPRAQISPSITSQEQTSFRK